MRPDDITEEEVEAAAFHLGGPLDTLAALAAQNALRDERVRADERERVLDRAVTAVWESFDFDAGTEQMVRDILAAAIREGGQHG